MKSLIFKIEDSRIIISEKICKNLFKNNIPKAMTNRVGADKKFDGGKTSGVAYVHDRKCYQE